MNNCYEFTAPTVNGASCAYATLNNYNQGNRGMSPPVPATTVSGYYVVPTWNYRPTYDTLVKGSCCGGYANILGAYGKNADSCDPQYVKKSCSLSEGPRQC